MTVRIVECYDLPILPEPGCVYRLLPRNFEEEAYWARVNRVIGWITRDEQEFLRNCVIALAGCGGMTIATMLLRAGFQTIRIADPEVFDPSNINRQLAAGDRTVGQSKAFATARYLRTEITDTSEIWVFPQGINQDTADLFVRGSDLVCDEIELLALTPRLQLHRAATTARVPLITGNTPGFGSRVWMHTETSQTLEELVGLTVEEASVLEVRFRSGQASPQERRDYIGRILDALVPELTWYTTPDSPYQDQDAVLKRLYEDGEASITPTNPSLATGLLADNVLFYLLRNSPVKRTFKLPPEAPYYLYLDAGCREFRVGKRIKRRG